MKMDTREEILKHLIVCANLYLEMDMSSSDEESEDYAVLLHTVCTRQNVGKAKVAVPVPRWGIDEYKSIVKMSLETFEFVYQLIAPKLTRLFSGMPVIDGRLQLMVALHKLTSSKTYRDASEAFQMKKSTGYSCTIRVVNALHSLAPAFIKWPSAAEAKKIANGFLAASGFPGIIGNIGQFRLKVLHFLEKDEEYEVPFQAICDNTKKITYCQVASPVNCKTSEEPTLELTLKGITMYPNTHLIGTSSYPLCDSIMVPYEEETNTLQRNYNKRLTAAFVIEECLQLLMSRFESLEHGLSMNEQVNKAHVVACCVLHNICKLKEDEYNGDRVQIKTVECRLGAESSVEAKRDSIARELV